MQLRIGQSPASLPIARYAKAFSLFEQRLEGGAPRRRTLETMRAEAPAGLVFAVVLPRAVTALAAEATPEDVASAVTTAELLKARFLVVRTPPTARPGSRTRERLTRLVGLLKPSGVSIAWEPAGLLAEADAELLAHSLGVTLVRDAGRDDLMPGPLAYTRLSSLGSAGRIKSSSLERAADRLAEFEEAFVVLEGQNAARAAKDLKSLLGLGGNGVPESDDEDSEEEDELEGGDDDGDEAAAGQSDEDDEDDEDETGDLDDEDEDDDEEEDEDEDAP